MKPWKPLSLACLSFALVACNSSDDNVIASGGVNQALTYELSENGCSTGRHTFPSFPEMCVGLQNNTLNNDCALDLRAQHFRRNCQGQTFSPFDGPVGDPSYPNDPDFPQDPNYPNYPGYPGGQGASTADVQISGFRNMYFRLDSSQNAGSAECYTANREFHLKLNHPEFANLGEQSQLLHLSFLGRGKRFPERVGFRSNSRDERFSVLLPGVDRPWSPRQESCEVQFNRRGRQLEASFDCNLDGRLQGRMQTIRMRATVNCGIERR
jgi:hypothetical protein